MWIDFSQSSLYIFIITTALIPFSWNLVARAEYNHQFLSRHFRSKKTACYFLAATIFTASLLRDWLFAFAISHQPDTPLGAFRYLAFLLFPCGSILVGSSMYRLGIINTYLGDYFGFLLDAPITSFPFNLPSPMYNGSSMLFLASAIWSESAAGILLSGWVWIVYQVALAWEDSFTAYIYSEAAKKGKKER